MGATAVAPLGSGPPSRLLLTAVGVGLVLLAALVAVYVLTPPPDHVAPGCLWWTAKPVDAVAAGEQG